MCVCVQFADGVYLILLMGLLEDYFVPLYNFFLTPESFEQKVISSSRSETNGMILISLAVYIYIQSFICFPSGAQRGICFWTDAGRRPEETQGQTGRYFIDRDILCYYKEG